ncbi:MAG: hypothetical protein JNM67_01695 [Bacteroidetes bacterium]|nr:hypothetical protein [Bacteroidota bacterium]
MESKDNPFGTEHRKEVIKTLLDKGLVKRITIIEGNYPTQKAQRDFLKRIIDWLNGKKPH